MDKILRWIGTALLSWVGGILAMVPIIPLGLGMDPRIVTALALMASALVAAAVACSAANWLLDDRKRTQVARTVGLSLLSAVLLWLLRYQFGESIVWDAPPVMILVKHTVMVALIATSAAWHWRKVVRGAQ
ncbi:MAG TPA: hypothetical protein VJK52_05160 [Candidatus Nanoarchaeia archaeon]|nr:hypothetical protein [Candidatus Nanoarchaeia archaeon]